MNHKLRILHLEDTPSDAQLVKRELKKGNFSFELLLVDNKPDFIKALNDFAPDLIISDHSLPSLNSFEALEIVKMAGIKIPFILVTATVSEDVAVALLHQGADDYLVKDRMFRLPTAVVNALEKHRLQNEKEKNLRQIMASETAFKEAERIAHFGVWNLNLINGATHWSDETFHLLGYELGELEASRDNFMKSLHPDERERIRDILEETIANGTSRSMDFQVKNKDGSIRYVNSLFVVERDEQGKALKLNGFNQDITEKKTTEGKLDKANRELSRVLDSVEECLYSIDATTGQYTYVSKACEKIYGYNAEHFYGDVMFWHNLLHPDDRSLIEDNTAKVNAGNPVYQQFRIYHKDGSIRWHESWVYPSLDIKGKLNRIDGIVKDITERKQAEVELQKSEANLRTIFENTDTTYILVDTKLNVLSFNQNTRGWAALDIYRSLKEGINFMECIPKDKQSIIRRQLQKVLNGKHLNFERDDIQPDGSIRYFSVRIFPVSNDKKEVIGLSFAISDITERKQSEDILRESEERYRLVSENPLLGIAWASLEGLVLDANDTFCHMLGYTMDELRNIHFGDITHPDDLVLEIPLVNKIISGEVYNYTIEKRYMTKQKNFVWTELNISRTTNQHGTDYFIGIIQDISARKAAEIEIKTLNESLEMKVIERTAQLEAANKGLEAFNYMVSHDLRNPLRAAEIFLSLLKKDKKIVADDTLIRYLCNIEECTTEMKELITRMLDFAKVDKSIGASGVEMSFIDMKELVAEVFKNLTILEDKREIKLLLKDTPAIYADRSLIKLLLTNLLSNAIKYSSKNEKTLVEVSGKSTGDFIEYSVKDHGAGFDMKQVDKLFQPFSRLHSSTEFKGTGAGLAIVDKIVKFHHGKVNAVSSVGEGATFSFSIPVKINE